MVFSRGPPLSMNSFCYLFTYLDTTMPKFGLKRSKFRAWVLMIWVILPMLLTSELLQFHSFVCSFVHSFIHEFIIALGIMVLDDE